MVTRWLAAAMWVAVFLAAPAVGSAASGTLGPDPGAQGQFEGEVLDLAIDWGDATACVVWGDARIAECFRSEAEMDRRITGEGATSRTADAAVVSLAQCSTPVRLYSATGFGGSVLALYERGLWINLSSYGFSNLTSSFRIGACSSLFAEGAGGSGSLYPSAGTQAGMSASTMVSGWNNRVSSVYIG